jgi:hypothetical protein
MIQELKQDISGLEALADWLGDGGRPVHPVLAEMRATRCARGNHGKACPLNRAPRWWEKAKEIVAAWIRKELELKNGMSLQVEEEEQIHMCGACGCCLRLKVWTPASHLRDHVDLKKLATLSPDYCWQRKELL